MPVRVTEPNPNWSTVGLRDYKDDWPLRARDYSRQAHDHKKQVPTLSLYFPIVTLLLSTP